MYMLMSEPLHNIVQEVGINPGFRSDHSIPMVVMTKNTSLRGTGFMEA